MGLFIFNVGLNFVDIYIYTYTAENNFIKTYAVQISERKKIKFMAVQIPEKKL